MVKALFIVVLTLLDGEIWRKQNPITMHCCQAAKMLQPDTACTGKRFVLCFFYVETGFQILSSKKLRQEEKGEILF